MNFGCMVIGTLDSYISQLQRQAINNYIEVMSWVVDRCTCPYCRVSFIRNSTVDTSKVKVISLQQKTRNVQIIIKFLIQKVSCCCVKMCVQKRFNLYNVKSSGGTFKARKLGHQLTIASPICTFIYWHGRCTLQPENDFRSL